jgi:hypothetical protein
MRPHAAEWEELSRIDYFLEHLARAVERGEVPMASYETLAPRYLSRREDLVAVLTYQPPETSAQQQAVPAAAYPQRSAAESQETGAAWPEFGPQAAAQPPTWEAPTARPAPRREPKPVPWTTILLFTGAFLVVAASAIFAFWAWDRMAAGIKLGALTAVTVGFYAAGWFTRARLGLKVGASALTVVASAMLLFDSWILIDGFDLPPEPAWSAALLVISLVYWLSETLLREKFYGITGAAAQVGWWWLMGSALHISQTWRLAGLAVIALLWALTAERAKGNESFGSLARMLLYAAPTTVVLTAAAYAANALMLGASSLPLAESGVVVALCGAVVVLRSSLADKRGRTWIAAALQLPLFTALLLPGDPSWLAAGLLAALTAAYALYALFEGGAPFTIAALFAELITAQVILEMLTVSDRRRAAVLAWLAVSWVASAAITRAISSNRAYERLRGATGFAPAAMWGGAALLAVSSLAAVVAGDGLPLTGSRTPSSDVVLAAVVLTAWAAASLLRRHPVLAAGAVLYSFYATAVLEAWTLPAAHSATFAALLAGVAAIWGAARKPMERFYALPEPLVGWSMRGFVLVIMLLGLIAETFYFTDGPSTWEGISLVVLVALVFLLDSLFGGPAFGAGMAAVLGVGAAALAGHRPHGFAGRTVLAASGTAVGLSVAGAALRDVWRERAVWLAWAGPAALVALGPLYFEAVWAVAAAILLWAVALVGAGFASRQQVAAAPAGVVAVLAVMSALSTMGAEWPLTVAAVGTVCALFGAVAWLPGYGRDEAHQTISGALAWAGGVGLLLVPGLGMETRLSALGEPSGATWIPTTPNGVAVSLLLLGAYMVMSAVRWRVDAFEYGGWGVMLLALLLRMHWGEVDSIEPYSTSVAVYAVGMSYLYAWRRGVPVSPAMDMLAVAVGAGLPALGVLSSAGEVAFRHLALAVGISTLFVIAGIAVRSRGYLYGGVTAIVIAVGWRTVVFLSGVWWVIIGLLGVAAIVVALTWERQRLLFADAQQWTRDWR